VTSPKHVIDRCCGIDEMKAFARLLLGWSGIAVDRSRGTSKANHQSGDNGCNPTARRLVNREVAAAAAATLRNALAVEKSDFIILGGVHDSPLEIGISNAVIVKAYVK
jgi:hypothetical protein